MPPKKLNKKTAAPAAQAAPIPTPAPAAVAADAPAPVATTTSTAKKGTKRGEAAFLSIASKGFENLPARSTKRAATTGPKAYKISRVHGGNKKKNAGSKGAKEQKKPKKANAKNAAKK